MGLSGQPLPHKNSTFKIATICSGDVENWHEDIGQGTADKILSQAQTHRLPPKIMLTIHIINTSNI